jgi:AmiR/NasT family two-component response regulator
MRLESPWLHRQSAFSSSMNDYEPWRRFVSSTLLKQPGFQVIGEVPDGLGAVRKAEELQPDLIQLDITVAEWD